MTTSTGIHQTPRGMRADLLQWRPRWWFLVEGTLALLVIVLWFGDHPISDGTRQADQLLRVKASDIVPQACPLCPTASSVEPCQTWPSSAAYATALSSSTCPVASSCPAVPTASACPTPPSPPSCNCISQTPAAATCASQTPQAASCQICPSAAPQAACPSLPTPSSCPSVANATVLAQLGPGDNPAYATCPAPACAGVDVRDTRGLVLPRQYNALVGSRGKVFKPGFTVMLTVFKRSPEIFRRQLEAILVNSTIKPEQVHVWQTGNWSDLSGPLSQYRAAFPRIGHLHVHGHDFMYHGRCVSQRREAWKCFPTYRNVDSGFHT